MKLAEALQERADINSRLAELYPRLSNNAIVQEGEKPAEDPQSLIDEIESCTARLAELIARINLTNCSIRVDGKTLTEMIAEKDALNAKINLYRNLIGAASNVAHRATRTEIKISRIRTATRTSRTRTSRTRIRTTTRAATAANPKKSGSLFGDPDSSII